MYLKNSKGEKSMTVTLSVVAFVIVMLKLLFNNSTIHLAGLAYSFGSIDAATSAAVLGPILGTYAFRRYTDTRFGQQLSPFDPSPYESYEVIEEVGSDLGSRPRDGRE